jgi:DNA-binding response OmpR family regulator
VAKVLVIEDDLLLSSVIRKWLELSRYVVELVRSGKDGLGLFAHYEYDAVILDLDIATTNGVSVLKELRSRDSNVAILALSFKQSILDKEVGYLAGADDYLTKPFDLRELSLRLGALLRRQHSLKPALLKSGNISLDTSAGKALKGGTELKLSPTEYALLEFFMRFPNHLFTVDDLLDHVWKSDSSATAVGVRTYITRLRKKIDEAGKPSMLATVHGQGYRLDAIGR